MMLAGRLSNRVDPRLLMLVGILMIAASAVGDDRLDAGHRRLVVRSSTRSCRVSGSAFVFMPLQVIAFATLPAEFRTDGTALFSLLRNIGSAIGVSVTSVLLTQNTQIVHAEIADAVTPFNRALQSAAPICSGTPHPAGIAALNAEVTRQARSSPMSTISSCCFWSACRCAAAAADAPAEGRRRRRRNPVGGALSGSHMERPTAYRSAPHPNQIDCILGAELIHDMGAMDLEGPVADFPAGSPPPCWKPPS